MKRIAVFTVGTGTGDNEDKLRSLAHGIASGIEALNPDEVYCVVSNDSMEKTIPYLMELVQDRYPITGYIRIHDVDTVSYTHLTLPTN